MAPPEQNRGARVEGLDLRGATVTDVSLVGARLHKLNLSAAVLRGSLLRGTRLRGVELVDVEIDGELQGVVVNGVDIGPLVEAELNRRAPERAKMRPDHSDGFREAWVIVAARWATTMARAAALPEAVLHRSVAGEWSFVQTLRHLSFASAAWVERMVLGDPAPWHPLDLPWDEAPTWPGIPCDRDVRPPLAEVLALRERRQATVAGVFAALTDEQLATTVTRTEPGWPQLEGFPLAECLRIVLSEEWEHRNYADRDLAVLEAELAADQSSPGAAGAPRPPGAQPAGDPA